MMNGHNSLDSFGAKRHLTVNGCSFKYYALDSLAGYGDVSKLPFSMKVLLENLLRHEDGVAVTREQILAVIDWLTECRSDREVQFTPYRILMQDFTGVPALAGLASMRDAVAEMGGDSAEINPSARVDLVIDHSVSVDKYASPEALERNVLAEMDRNQERYQFLKWAQGAFDNLRVVPPGSGICHQANLEYLADVVCSENGWLFPDTLIGTDSHTTMINGLGVLGWGGGGIEAEATMLGQPVSMVLPEVIGVRLVGELQEGVTATDLVLTITEILRKRDVVGKLVEFYGPSLAQLSLADRATIANMAPEYGATCSYFPIDEETIRYLTFTARDESLVNQVEAYSKANGLWHDSTAEVPLFTDTVTIYLDLVEPSVSGPKRPQDRLSLGNIKKAMFDYFAEVEENPLNAFDVPGEKYCLSAGDVVIAAITSCTNTSNPAVMMAAGLIAKKAVERGLAVKPWVKTSLAPGSKVVTDYLVQSGLQGYLDQLGFYLVGYGCTTCIGNSGPLDANIAQVVEDNQLTVCSVLSGNRNFEGRIHAQVKANWLASPPLVVAFALAGTTLIDFGQEPIGVNHCGEDVFLRDIWPTNHEIEQSLAFIRQKFFRDRYASIFKGDHNWHSLSAARC